MGADVRTQPGEGCGEFERRITNTQASRGAVTEGGFLMLA